MLGGLLRSPFVTHDEVTEVVGIGRPSALSFLGLGVG